VVYMPNEDRESSECGDPAPPLVSEVASAEKTACGKDSGDAVPDMSLDDVGDNDELSVKKSLLGDAHGDTENRTSSASENESSSRRVKLEVKDEVVPRRSSTDRQENVTGVTDSDNVVYKGDRVRFQVTKLDTPTPDALKQPAATEAAVSATDLVVERKDEKSENVMSADEADIVMERLTLREVGVMSRHRLLESTLILTQAICLLHKFTLIFFLLIMYLQNIKTNNKTR